MATIGTLASSMTFTVTARSLVIVSSAPSRVGGWLLGGAEGWAAGECAGSFESDTVTALVSPLSLGKGDGGLSGTGAVPLARDRLAA